MYDEIDEFLIQSWNVPMSVLDLQEEMVGWVANDSASLILRRLIAIDPPH